MPRPSPITPDQELELVRLYVEERVSRNELALRFNASRPFVTDCLRRNGVNPRGIREASRLHNGLPVRHDAFAEPLSAEARYWIGFLMADGCVSFQRFASPHIILGVSAVDRAHLEAFRRFLGAEHAIMNVPATTRVLRGREINIKEGVRLDVCSEQLAADLARYGVVPNKTRRTVAVPSMERDVDFWRGAVDGDGWVGYSVRRGKHRKEKLDPRICLVGTHQLVGQWSAFIRTITDCAGTVGPDKGCWQCGATGRHAVRVIQALYSGCHVALPRKLQIAQEILEGFGSLLDTSIGYRWQTKPSRPSVPSPSP